MAKLENGQITFIYDENGHNFMAGTIVINEDSITVIFIESDFIYINAGDFYTFLNLTPSESLFRVIHDTNEGISLFIGWEDDSGTNFIRNEKGDWLMYGRAGDNRVVFPDFSINGTTLEIRFPNTERVYFLYDDLNGIFGDEEFWWGFEVF